MTGSEASSGPDSAVESKVLLLQDELVEELGELRVNLVELVESGAEVVLDAAGVEVIGTAALQLIAAFVNRADELKRSFQWRNCSEEFLLAVRLAGLRQHLATGSAGSGQ